MCGCQRRRHTCQDGFGVVLYLTLLFLHLWTVRRFNDALTNDLVNPLLWDINIWSSINNTSEGRCSASLSENLALRERLGSLLKTKVCRAQVHYGRKESKGELIYLHEKYIAEEILEEERKGLEK